MCSKLVTVVSTPKVWPRTQVQRQIVTKRITENDSEEEVDVVGHDNQHEQIGQREEHSLLRCLRQTIKDGNSANEIHTSEGYRKF